MSVDPGPKPAFPAVHHTGRPAFPVFAADVPVLSAPDARTEAARAIEAVVMAATEPVPAHNLAELVECSVDLVAAICRELAEQYEREQRGFVLRARRRLLLRQRVERRLPLRVVVARERLLGQLGDGLLPRAEQPFLHQWAHLGSEDVV